MLNLDDSIAITQNFVSSVNLHHVLNVLRSPNSELVSGCEDDEKATLFSRFLEALRAEHPLLAEQWDGQEELVAQRKGESARLTALFQSNTNTAVVGADDAGTCCQPEQAGSSSFSFGFSL